MTGKMFWVMCLCSAVLGYFLAEVTNDLDIPWWVRYPFFFFIGTMVYVVFKLFGLV